MIHADGGKRGEARRSWAWAWGSATSDEEKGDTG